MASSQQHIASTLLHDNLIYESDVLSWHIQQIIDRYQRSGDDEYWEILDSFANDASLLDERPPSISEAQIKTLPIVTLTDDHIKTESQCSICIDDFHSGEKVKRLPCNHCYHGNCIDPWLKKTATCPKCRVLVNVKLQKRKSRRPRRSSWYQPNPYFRLV